MPDAEALRPLLTAAGYARSWQAGAMAFRGDRPQGQERLSELVARRVRAGKPAEDIARAPQFDQALAVAVIECKPSPRSRWSRPIRRARSACALERRAGGGLGANG